MPKALITGITGQDGSYLAETLLDKGYEVIGMVRRTSVINLDRLRNIQNKITLVQGDLLDQVSMVSVLREFQPDEVYVPDSAEVPSGGHSAGPARSAELLSQVFLYLVD